MMGKNIPNLRKDEPSAGSRIQWWCYLSNIFEITLCDHESVPQTNRLPTKFSAPTRGTTLSHLNCKHCLILWGPLTISPFVQPSPINISSSALYPKYSYISHCFQIVGQGLESRWPPLWHMLRQASDTALSWAAGCYQTACKRHGATRMTLH